MVKISPSPLSPTPLPPTGEGLTHLAGFDLKSPAAAPSIAGKAGVFGEDCLSEASSAAARFGEKRREAEGRGRGYSFLWLLSFEQAKESHSPRGESNCYFRLSQNHQVPIMPIKIENIKI